MSLKAMSDYTFTSKYPRYLKEKNRRETWEEAVHRVRDMHVRKYPNVAEHIHWAFDQVLEKRVLGSQRALQFGGTPIEVKNSRIYNCTVSYCDRIKFFQEAFWLLLCGCGVGFSAQIHHVAKLPDFSLDVALGIHRPKKTFVIPDTIEGWADALGILLATFMPHPDFPEWSGYEVEFDYSKIRLKGSPLASGVGKAPGPEPLRRSLEIIRKLLHDRVALGLKRLRPIDAYDVLMHASDAVLSGGVRRSATICLFSPEDELMLNAKTGNWFVENPQRARSNNSVLLIRNKTSHQEFMKVMDSVKEFGEPGFVWADDTECLYNPCVEIGFEAYDEFGNSGWHFCNLCEINGGAIKTFRDWLIAAKAAAIIGTLQAGYVDFGYLGNTTTRIVEKEALLGVSITGMMDSPDILFNPKLQKKAARFIVKINEWFAKLIGINPAARCTCIKPSGTTSCLLCTASGIHAHHDRRYLRHMQGNSLEAPLQFFELHNPCAVEDSVWSANKTDKVLAFCITIPEGAKTKKDINAVQLLEYVKLTKMNWVEAGKVEERCAKPWISNNVSNTINVKPDEWDDVAHFIYENRQHFAGISLLSTTGDLDYPQAPMVSVKTEQELVNTYGTASFLVMDLINEGICLFDHNLWSGCDVVLGINELVAPEPPHCTESCVYLYDVDPEIENEEYNLKYIAYEYALAEYKTKKLWVQKVIDFARHHFGNDIKKATYLLKDIYYFKKWNDLQREYVDVDYSMMYEEEDNTTAAENWACSGGKCDVF